jgi:hypothetical protein
MLDRCPETEPIFLAGRLESELLAICRQISVFPEREHRLALGKEAEGIVSKMRENAVRNFGGRPFIMENLQALQAAVLELAGKPAALKGDNICPVCGGPLSVRHDSTKRCGKCLDRIYEYLERLESDDGFSTCSI